MQQNGITRVVPHRARARPDDPTVQYSLFVCIFGTMAFSRYGLGTLATHNNVTRNTRGDPKEQCSTTSTSR
jgi:hypothetical protein